MLQIDAEVFGVRRRVAATVKAFGGAAVQHPMWPTFRPHGVWRIQVGQDQYSRPMAAGQAAGAAVARVRTNVGRAEQPVHPAARSGVQGPPYGRG